MRLTLLLLKSWIKKKGPRTKMNWAFNANIQLVLQKRDIKTKGTLNNTLMGETKHLKKAKFLTYLEGTGAAVFWTIYILNILLDIIYFYKMLILSKIILFQNLHLLKYFKVSNQLITGQKSPQSPWIHLKRLCRAESTCHVHTDNQYPSNLQHTHCGSKNERNSSKWLPIKDVLCHKQTFAKLSQQMVSLASF